MLSFCAQIWDLGRALREGMTHTLGPTNGDQRHIPASVCVLRRWGGAAWAWCGKEGLFGKVSVPTASCTGEIWPAGLLLQEPQSQWVGQRGPVVDSRALRAVLSESLGTVLVSRARCWVRRNKNQEWGGTGTFEKEKNCSNSWVLTGRCRRTSSKS